MCVTSQFQLDKKTKFEIVPFSPMSIVKNILKTKIYKYIYIYMSILKWLGTYSGRAGNKNKSKIDTVSLMKIHQKENTSKKIHQKK